MSDITFTQDQGQAIKAVLRWLKRHQMGKKAPMIFRVFGWAGTGKTTIAKYIVDAIQNGEQGVNPGTVIFAAFTGKAAARLMVKGCKPASTIHRAIYRPKINENTGQVEGFTLNRESPLVGCVMGVMDEVSMTDEVLGRDWMSFSVPTLVFGDPGQLPPIEGQGYFTQAEPDILLTEITRQAAESPIIHLATKARLGESIDYGDYGDVKVLPSTKEVSDKWLGWADQVLCGANSTRKGVMNRIRELKGYKGIYPSKGEKLICLKNNHDRGLLNGTHWQCTAPQIKPMKTLLNWKEVKQGWQQPRWAESKYPALWFNARSMDFKEADGSPLIVRDIQVSAHHFNPALDEPPFRDRANTEWFDFGDPITVHKAQGSEWDNVMLINESYLFREWAKNHFYTGITRAAGRLVIRL